MTRQRDSPVGLVSSLMTSFAVLTVGLIPIFRMGPLDVSRTVYNFAYGDAPVLKQELLNYCRREIQRSSPDFTEAQVDNKLRTELMYEFNGAIDPSKVSIEFLWDAQEDFAKSRWDRFVWADLRQ